MTATRTCAAALLLALSAQAQTGPFADGEVLVRGNLIAFDYGLWRVNLTTGEADTVVTGLLPSYSKSGWIAYDPWREGVLAYTSWAPVGMFSARLYLFRADKTVTQLGFVGEKLTDLAPVGDGRVYLRRDGVLHLLDASNQLVPIPDAAGQPVDIAAEHLVYHAPSNSLIGATGTGYIQPCSAFNQLVVHRLPLTADGLALSGPPTCQTWNHGSSGAPVGLDPLPDGGFLMTIAGGVLLADDRMVRVDPWTLAVTPWAKSEFNDLDGGFWSQAIGAAVVLEDKDDLLRAYQKGQQGPGTLVPVAVSIGENTSGWSSDNQMIDIEVGADACAGSVIAFGQGSSGKAGVVPLLGAGTCPEVGGTLHLTLGNGVAGATAVIALSAASAPYPLFGGTGYLLPPLFATYPLTLSGSGASAAIGFGAVSIPIPSVAALTGLTVFAQGAVVDAAAQEGFALTAGLAVIIG
ncbi:hypothetical protein [Engelhardtia mirabilis]|uniref:Uncharacterized protein n=1 Tax=Engelhardtia mirabilis TaxID=2528011 RepID=A0A518BP84_9BACT|nr:hypothetical protein Pla133_38460 [Planctomycetes bacterium Pla133]QDV03070.1 hypothetical protein Pla86_38450 [Planctomycetes bacterium Pla86]